MERKAMIDRASTQLSLRRQCELLAVNRNRLDPPLQSMASEDLQICRHMDEIHLKDPTFGTRRIRKILQRDYDCRLSRRRIRRLMKHMGIGAIYRRPRTSLPGKGKEHKLHPYLLRGLEIRHPDQVWCADITYLPMGRSFAYLVVVMDWHSRAVLSWKLSNTLDSGFCVEALLEAQQRAGTLPRIFNTDQGSQFTSVAWCGMLEKLKVKISMDGRGCWVDNVFIERLWRSLKYEEVYLRDYEDLHELELHLAKWFEKYNHWRPHQGLNYALPWEVYRPDEEEKIAA